MSPSERTLFTHLAVFQGGFTLEAAEAICAIPSAAPVYSTSQVATLELKEVAGGLASLLDQSLLLRQDNAPESRFTMLETIREFALEQLHACNEHEAIQARHASYFYTWAEQAEANLYGPDQVTWLRRLEQELDHLQAALTWLLRAGQLAAAVQFACGLGVFWQRCGRYSEGRAWLEQVLERTAKIDVPNNLRTRAAQTAATLAYRQGDSSISLPCDGEPGNL